MYWREVAERVKSEIDCRDYLQKADKGGFCCPVCGSGTGPKKTGAVKYYPKSNTWACHSGSCVKENGKQEGGDVIRLYQKTYGVDFNTALTDLAGKRRINEIEWDGAGSVKPKTSEPKPDERVVDPGKQKQTETPSSIGSSENIEKIRNEIGEYYAALPGSEGESYFHGRGFTDETIDRFNLGYDKKRRCVVIPYNRKGTYYVRRYIGDPPEGRGKYDVLPTSTAGSEPLFNHGALWSDGPVYVCEGPIDAISIVQAGGAAVATCGAGGPERLMSYIKDRPPKSPIVICMDNDDAGRKMADQISTKLTAAGIYFVDGSQAILGDAKDANEALTQDEDKLRAAIKSFSDDVMHQYDMANAEADQERQQRTGVAMMDAWLANVQTRMYEPISTGIASLDYALDGGFMRKCLVLLGAAPGVGKTAMAQWIFEGFAENGMPCIFINLEMARDMIIARSMSRFIMRNYQKKFRTTFLLRSYLWSNDQRQIICKAHKEYTERIAQRMIYNPEGVGTDLTRIMDYLNKEAQRAESKGEPVPYICLDYLQFLSTSDPKEDSTTLLKRAVTELKRFAMAHNTLVLAIMAHNRDSNKSGQVTMESGRDTSTLEYSADVQLGMTFLACLPNGSMIGAKGKDPNALNKTERQDIVLKVVKGRFGGVGETIQLKFDGETMSYTDVNAQFTKVNEKTPFEEPQQLRFDGKE